MYIEENKNISTNKIMFKLKVYKKKKKCLAFYSHSTAVWFYHLLLKITTESGSTFVY